MMMLSYLSSHPVVNRRAGLSKVELIGCLIAVTGGLWIGAQYLNVDLHGAAYQALDETELLAKIPEEWRPANPQCPNGDCPDPAEARAADEARLRSKLEELRSEAARLSGGFGQVTVDPADAPSLTPEEEQLRDRTHAYWQGLSEIVFEVTAIKNLLGAHSGTDQHARALAVRRRVLEYGQEATQMLSIEGVDPEAVATGGRISEWYGQAAEQMLTALELKSSQPVGGRSVSGADVWASTEADLQMRTDLVRRKSQETSAYLTSKYFTDFSPLGL